MSDERSPLNELINILIVEDDRLYRESIQELINDSPLFVCHHAYGSVEKAIDALKKGFVPEVILLDIDLPGISGIEGIQHFRKRTPSSRIIILTVFDDDKNIFNAICHGAVGYLLKSSSSEEICNYIELVLKGGAVMTPQIASKVLTMFTQFSVPTGTYGLTEREKELLKLLVNGMSKKHIAGHLNISLHTVNTHLKNIYAKLQVHSQIDMVSKALRERLI